ncbi:MAG: discoidin domain-containing protein, partial [Ruminococcaceae bacterium]|nr:discoidin domain-containing protein [Oscillospiraceae bacterium]
RYMAISYRTNSATDGQFFMGSGQGWTGNGDQFLQAWNEDGNWNLAIIDLHNVGLTAFADDILNYARLDFFTDAGAEGDYFDIEYIAFFNTAEAAAKYDFEMHKAPMWDADKSVIAHQSFDQFYYGNGGHDEAALDENLTLYHAANRPDWDFVADMVGKDHEYLTYWGWVATKSETIGQFGYQFNGGAPVYDAAWTHATEQPVIDAAKQLGGVNGSRMKIFIPVAGLEGENTLRVLYKDADGNEVCLNEITVIMPTIYQQFIFESDIMANFEGSTEDVDLKYSDLSMLFDQINYGAGEPMYVRYNGGNPFYNVTHFTSIHTKPDGQYAFNVNVTETGGVEGQASIFVRGYRLASIENHFFGQDGNDVGGVSMGGAGIYINYIARGEGYALRLNIKTYADGKYIPNLYYVPVDSSDITIADNGSTVYVLAGGKLAATIAISGVKDYGISTQHGSVPADALAEKAVLTTSEGTFELDNACVAANFMDSDLGIATRTGTINFNRVTLKGFNTVVIPEDFYVPAKKHNVAVGKPVYSDSVENETNIASNATDGNESTRWGALPNGEASMIVDLEKVYHLVGISAYFETANWAYTISISEDNENYIEIYRGEPHSAKVWSIDGEADVRYIKFTRLSDAEDQSTPHWFSIYEVYAYTNAPDEPEGEYYENLTVPQDQWVISGHMPQLVAPDHATHGAMVAAGGVESAALLHQGSIYLGNIDLSKYSKIVIMWGSDNSQVTIDAYNANANNRFALVNSDKNMVMSPAEETIIAAATYELHGWAVAPFEIDLTGVDYSGDVYLTHDSLPGGFALVYSVEFIGGEIVEEPTVENVVIDLSTIEGHQATNNYGYDCPVLTIGYDKVFFMGDIDLNKYAQIIIEYSYDGDTVVEGKPVEQNWAECGRAPIIGFTALNKSFGFANVTNQDAIDNGIYTDLPHTPGTWAAASRTAVIEIPENIGYNGPCYLSAYNPWFREIAVSSITLVPRA